MAELYHFKKRPYVHQVQALRKILGNGYGGALLMEPRTGKTKVAVDYIAIQHIKGRVSRVVVFCPVGVMGVWEEQLKENCPIPYTLTYWDKKGRKKHELPRFGKPGLDIVIVNYDALSTPGAWRIVTRGRNKGKRVRSRKGGRFEVINRIKLWQPHLIILDESHRIKSPSAKKSTAIHTLGGVADYRLIMTGTVVTKSKKLFDVYSQWKFLNPDRFAGMTFADFKSHYGKWVQIGEHWSKWTGNKNEEELHREIHKDAFSITREECYDLPKQTDQVIYVELDETVQVYTDMAEEMIAKIHTGEITEASIRLTQRIRLQQITSGISKTAPSPNFPEGRLVVIGNEKLRAMQSRLEDLMEADEKVVIGALFRADIQRIQTMAKKLKVPVFTIQGGMKQHEREYARKEFPKISGGAIFIGQPASAGEGIDLSAASILQWYSLTPSWVNFRQFSDRIALSEKPTFHEFFLARGTIDELMYETLLEDGDIGKKMISSPERLLRLQESSW